MPAAVRGARIRTGPAGGVACGVATQNARSAGEGTVTGASVVGAPAGATAGVVGPGVGMGAGAFGGDGGGVRGGLWVALFGYFGLMLFAVRGQRHRGLGKVDYDILLATIELVIMPTL